MLILHHSNNLDKLTEILLQKMAEKPAAVLEPEKILVQNPGMKRWLQQSISHSCGIAANLQFPLPSRFIWDIFLSQFDDIQDLSAYDAEVLRWRLFQILRKYQDDKRFSALSSYQKQDERGIACFQLATKMAGLYDQYLVYRPQMIRNWEQGGKTSSSTEAWQAELWRLLRTQTTEPHRAELIQRLIRRLQNENLDNSQLPDNLYVFGISAMSPLYLNVLAVLGQHIDVHVFNLNPCKHYWGDLQSQKEQINQGHIPYVENELLASLGKQGRDFTDQFYETGVDYEENIAFVDFQPANLLQQVKYDIINLSRSEGSHDNKKDHSIRIVSCYSELRELQVLHDHLLDMLENDKDLQADDIVVMCPDINTLAPYIDAVFGQQAEHKKIPYSISDNDVMSSSPLLQAIMQWIGLSGCRFTATDILAWLELPALQRAYSLDTDAIEVIRHWIKSNHVHWGLDAQHKKQLQLGAENINTWWHAITRLLSAYIMNSGVQTYQDHVTSETIISADEFKILGQLHKLLKDLSDWSQKFSSRMTVNEWQQNITGLIQNLLQLDDDEEWLIKPLRDEVMSWTLQAEQSEFDQPLDALIIVQLLQQLLSQGSAHHQYLTGRVNFCNLIPMRTLPFKVVCLIGLGEDRFPRTEIPLQFDLISLDPKKGDRSRREDDRYMFLQSLLSSESNFYISYVGQDKKDDSVIEPSVVVREFIEHVKQTTGHVIDIEKTPLQPFSETSFEKGSFADQWLIYSSTNEQADFNQAINQAGEINKLDLNELIRFYKNPPRYFMENCLNISLGEFNESIEDDEKFALEPLQRTRLYDDLLRERLDAKEINSQKYLMSGQLAEQSFGKMQFLDLQDNVNEMYSCLTANETFSGLNEFQISLKIDNLDLSGKIKTYSEQGLLTLNPSTLNGRYLVSLWIQHCVLCASQPIRVSEFYYKDKSKNFYHKKKFTLLGRQQAQDELKLFIEGYRQGQQHALLFFANTAFEYEKEKINKGELSALEKIRALWTVDEFNSFYEARDIYLLSSLKNSGFTSANFPDAFFRNSSRYMSRVMQQLQVSG